jgi:hypothetical protein
MIPCHLSFHAILFYIEITGVELKQQQRDLRTDCHAFLFSGGRELLFRDSRVSLFSSELYMFTYINMNFIYRLLTAF